MLEGQDKYRITELANEIARAVESENGAGREK
jgi:hypothetical protein